MVATGRFGKNEDRGQQQLCGVMPLLADSCWAVTSGLWQASSRMVWVFRNP